MKQRYLQKKNLPNWPSTRRLKMSDNFLFIPDTQIFDTAFTAINKDESNSCLLFFRKAWIYYIDSRERVILISKELDKDLLEKNYKSKKNKKDALLSVVEIHETLP